MAKHKRSQSGIDDEIESLEERYALLLKEISGVKLSIAMTRSAYMRDNMQQRLNMLQNSAAETQKRIDYLYWLLAQ
jgi:hypothetical protein